MDDLPRIPFPYHSVAELLKSHAQQHGDKPAIIAVNVDTLEGDTISYQQLYSLAASAASWLTAIGIRRGQRFAILMPNTPEVLILELAGALIGASTVPLDAKRDTIDRKLFKLTDTDAKALFVRQETNFSNDSDAIKRALPGLYIRTWTTFGEFTAMLKGSAPVTEFHGSLEDCYIILYTSGTTALPKGVILSVKSCLLNAMGILHWQQLTQQDRCNIVLPLHHINSTQFSLSTLIAGGTVILNSRYSVRLFWEIIHRYSATITSIVPTILHDLLMKTKEYQAPSPSVSTLKRICIGSAPVLPEETLRFYEVYGIRVTQGYGQTETALRVAGVPIDTDESVYRSLVKSNTIGMTLANNHLAIMDLDNTEKNEGEEGEICISGPILADGYLNNPEETASAFKDGWFHSGDVGYWKMIDGRKYFFIIGRLKEIIIKGGVNISPSAIEDSLLRAFPEIDEVSVVGYPDERMGEEIAAAVVFSHSRNRGNFDSGNGRVIHRILDTAQRSSIPGLSRYEAPQKIFVFDSLPKTSTGKIQRVEVKKAVAEMIKNETSKQYDVRQIASHERDLIKKALNINNARFPFVPATLEEFTARVHHGLLFGVFDRQKGLIGSLSCLRLNAAVIQRLKTWNEATATGTLANHNPQGDTLLCVAISVQSRESGIRNHAFTEVSAGKQESGKELQVLAKKHVSSYVRSDKDHVLNFHRKSKAGIAGASVWKILENGRPQDQEAMGYNVLMKYPNISESTTLVLTHTASPATALIEHALQWAKEQKIKDVIAFSRPSGFKSYLESMIA